MSELLNNELKILKDYKIVCGADEAGRGPLAGPVVCAAVSFNLDILENNDNEEIKYLVETLNDSKKLSESKRNKLFPLIKKYAQSYSIILIDPETIDTLNILWASLEGMDRAIESLSVNPDLCLIDGNKLPPRNASKSRFIIKGDSKYLSIAAASVLAKVTRDNIMLELHEKHPVYNWKKNKGYPTKEHMQAIDKHGITKHHRLSFSPCSQATIPGLF